MASGLHISIDLGGSTPVYVQIADELRKLIATGKLQTDDKLPSVRDLAHRVGVNLNTVAKAYRALADEGLLGIEHGAGVRVVATSVAAPADLAQQLDTLVSRFRLAGQSRRAIEAAVRGSLDRIFNPKS